jgi:hypothetical protein
MRTTKGQREVWKPATVVHADRFQLGVVFADHMRLGVPRRDPNRWRPA